MLSLFIQIKYFGTYLKSTTSTSGCFEGSNSNVLLVTFTLGVKLVMV